MAVAWGASSPPACCSGAAALSYGRANRSLSRALPVAAQSACRRSRSQRFCTGFCGVGSLRQPNASAPGNVASSAHRLPRLRVGAEVAAQEPVVQKAPSFKQLKQFLEDAKGVGRVRIIVNTGMGVLESVTDMEGLFYQALPGKGEYANLIKGGDNVDFHLLLDKVDEIHLVEGTSMRGGHPTYTMRFYDAQKANGASIFVMWRPGTSGEYDPAQIDGFKRLTEKYGTLVKFSYEGSEEASRL